MDMIVAEPTNAIAAEVVGTHELSRDWSYVRGAVACAG
jgi:hypothetical protein